MAWVDMPCLRAAASTWVVGTIDGLKTSVRLLRAPGGWGRQQSLNLSPLAPMAQGLPSACRAPVGLEDACGEGVLLSKGLRQHPHTEILAFHRETLRMSE